MAHEAQPSVSLMFLPHFAVLCDLLHEQTHVIYYMNRRTATWNLFVLYYKELKYTEKSLFISNFPTLTDTKIAFDVIYCLYKMKRTDWLLCLAKNCDWFKESRHCQIWIERRLSWKRQSLWKLNQNCVINKSDTKCRKKSSHFLSSERLCKPKNTWTLPWILQELKKPLGKLAVAVDIETLEAIRFELCMSGALVTVEICVLCGWWFWSAYEMVSQTLSSCDTDGREL